LREVGGRSATGPDETLKIRYHESH
jgi:hypothetical protein